MVSKRTNLYQDFILKNTTDLEEMQSVLSVLSFIKQLYFYINSKKAERLESEVYKCIQENFKNNNELDWQVFALNPGRMVFWTLATCEWEKPIEK